MPGAPLLVVCCVGTAVLFATAHFGAFVARGGAAADRYERWEERQAMAGRMLRCANLEQADLIGQQNHQVRFDQIGHQSGERVIVAETQFFVGNRVVFVDYRHHTHPEQGTQGAAGIQVAMAVGKIIMRQQHLGSMQATALKTAFPGMHQTHLPNCRHRLQIVQDTGPFVQLHAAHALCHRARRDQYHLMASGDQVRLLFHPVLQAIAVQAASIRGDQGTADLDHPAAGIFYLIVGFHLANPCMKRSGVRRQPDYRRRRRYTGKRGLPFLVRP